MSGALALAAFLVAAPAAAPAITFLHETTVAGPAVSLGDLADLSGAPAGLRARAAALVVARLPAGRSLALATRDVAGRARGQMPALAPWLDAAVDQRIIVHARPAAAAASTSGTCLRLTQPVADGAVVTQADVAPSDCGGAPPDPALGYDRHVRAECALRALAPGEVVRAPAVPLAAVRPGQPLFLETRAGPVLVQREVEALQAAAPGGRLFVRSAEGQVFAAALGTTTP